MDQKTFIVGLDATLHTGLTAAGVGLFTAVNPVLGAAFGLIHTITHVALLHLLDHFCKESKCIIENAYWISSALATLATIGLAAGAMFLFGVPFTIATLAVVALSLVAGSALLFGIDQVINHVRNRINTQSAQDEISQTQDMDPPLQNEARQPQYVPHSPPRFQRRFAVGTQISDWDPLLWFYPSTHGEAGGNLARNIREAALDCQKCPYKTICLVWAMQAEGPEFEPHVPENRIIIYFTKTEEEKKQLASGHFLQSIQYGHDHMAADAPPRVVYFHLPHEDITPELAALLNPRGLLKVI